MRSESGVDTFILSAAIFVILLSATVVWGAWR
jgi:hypothetical protein